MLPVEIHIKSHLEGDNNMEILTVSLATSITYALEVLENEDSRPEEVEAVKNFLKATGMINESLTTTDENKKKALLEEVSKIKF